MAELEARGVPTVTMATTQFAYEAAAQWEALGFRDRSVVEVTHPFGHLPAEVVSTEAERILAEVVARLTGGTPDGGGR